MFQILVVEDDADLQNLFCKTLKEIIIRHTGQKMYSMLLIF